MTKLIWGRVGERFYENGVDRGVFYPKVGPGVVWNGLVSVSEDTSGGDIESLYTDGNKYYDFVAAEDFQATIEAISAPDEFLECDGVKTLAPGLYATQQPRRTFNFSYRTMISSDSNENAGYKLHLVYNATAAPSSNNYKSTSDKPDVGSRSWSIYTVPPESDSYKPTAHFVIDTRYVSESIINYLEGILYGTTSTSSRIPTAGGVIDILTSES